MSGDNRVTLPAPDPGAFKFFTDWVGDVLLFSVNSQTSSSDVWSLRVNPDGTPAAGAIAEPYLQTSAFEGNARHGPTRRAGWVTRPTSRERTKCT